MSIVSYRGSIPAGAGETLERLFPNDSFEVDPRGCGGDRSGQREQRNDPGRSPRVRGRPRAARRLSACPRSIPAGAGETQSHRPFARGLEVDPRGCGGDETTSNSILAIWGRSPRVRGRHRVPHGSRQAVRSIPAGAGETWKTCRHHRHGKVDPRGCGGDTGTGKSIVIAEGRSPRVRGRPPRGVARPASPGSIPAGAGETVAQPCRSVEIRVDPRGCGGDPALRGRGSLVRGRSPRVRGRPP